MSRPSHPKPKSETPARRPAPSEEIRAIRQRTGRPPLVAAFPKIVAQRAAQLAPEGTESPNSDGAEGGRDRSGKFTAGNRAALVHGGRSQAHVARLVEDARAALAEQQQAIVADLGGADQLSTLQLDLVGRYAVAGALLSWMEDELLRTGVVTSKGRKRALFGAYAVQLGNVSRLAQALGLERRVRRVRSLSAALAAAEVVE